MSSPGRRPGAPPARERLAALFLLGVAVVLLASSPTWFGSGRAGVGLAQLFLAAVLAVVGLVLHRRSARR